VNKIRRSRDGLTHTLSMWALSIRKELAMRFLNRNREPEQQQNATHENAAGGNLSQLRLAGEELLAAGADAISRTLSTDSEAFLAATKQQGGQ
jgi:hypothetical protein